MTLEREFRQDLDLGGGKRVTIGLATADDVLRIRWLYHRVYGGSYPFTLVYDPRECAKAIESDRYLWFLARDGDQAVGSLIFTVDRSIFLGKVFGGVVAEEYRGHDLAEKMLNFGLDIGVKRLGAARCVYATTRTVNLAPQRLVEKAGFKKLGIFPNVHKVQRSETHTLAVFYADGALEKRAGNPRLPLLLKPFFEIVRRETGLPDAEYLDLPFPADDPSPATQFEVIQAPQFVLRRFAEVRASGKLVLDFFPFHDPNLLLMSPDGKTEIFVYRSTKDGHCVLIGAASENLPLGRMLDHGASFLGGWACATWRR
jgi:RimJ/RimL family protein N-acetyltransferase